MKDLISAAILIVVVATCLFVFETYAPTRGLNGGPGAMTAQEAVLGVGIKIY